MIKYLWIQIEGEDHWKSSRRLVDSWKSAYQCRADIDFRDISTINNKDEILAWTDEIDFNPDVIIVADPRVNIVLLKSIFKTQFFFLHILGDPVKKIIDIYQQGLFKDKTNLIVGSLSNYRILSNIVSQNIIKYLPFNPIVETQNNLSIKRNKFLYMGRIAYFKNVHHLIKLFQEYCELNFEQIELTIAGALSNANLPAEPIGHYIGYPAEKFYLLLEEVKNSNLTVNYLGHLDESSLRHQVARADVVVSLSTAPEEDFGLSILEALGFDKPCILTRWGGYREFEGIEGVSFVPVEKIDNELLINKRKLFDLIKKGCTSNKEKLTEWQDKRDHILRSTSLEPTDGKLLKDNDFKIKFGDFHNAYERYVSPYWD